MSSMSTLGNIADNWQNCRTCFLITTELAGKPQKVQCTQLLHYIGEEAFKSYRTFTFTDAERDVLNVLLNKFKAHFMLKENTNYLFFSSKELPGQSVEQFITELKQRAMKCKLKELEDDLVKTMIVCDIVVFIAQK